MKPPYNPEHLAFEGKNDIWTQIMLVIDLNIKSEVEEALSVELEGEKRAFQCGRASCIKDFKRLLLEIRKEGMDRKNMNWTTDEELNNS
jgi:hypothetical protein